MPTTKPQVLKSLENKHYHKLIIGAALKDFESIENYAYLFTHAQANAIDISAFPLSLISTQRGIAKAITENPELSKPLIMVSVNIGEDPHFRRIELNTDTCTECLLCIPSCPANAFSLIHDKFNYEPNLCYGCSNCLPYCNYDALSFENWNSSSPETISELIALGATAFEIHLSPDLEAFKDFYSKLPANNKILESFSIGSGLLDAEQLIDTAITIVKTVRDKYQGTHPLVLQTDGIPLSGARDLYSLEQSGYKLEAEDNKDLVSIENARIVIEALDKAGLRDSVYVQISGGSTERSLAKAHAIGIPIAGVAIGSYARKKLNEASGDLKNVARTLISGTMDLEVLTPHK